MIDPRPLVYLSHPICGNSTASSHDEILEIMEYNNLRALCAGAAIRAACPHINLYIPAESEDFVMYVYENYFLTIHDILEMDCSIVGRSKAVLYYNHEGRLSRGMMNERDEQCRKGIPAYYFSSIDDVPKCVRPFINERLGVHA